MPNINPATVIIMRGPNLSVSLPTAIERRPVKIQVNENPPEVVARDHPNSCSTGAKKTPKEKRAPHITIDMKKAAATIT
jgi:hypothetical protein